MRNFHHTVNILVQAYLNDTLIHGRCYACAVGNIIRGNGVHLECWLDDHETFWLRYIEATIRNKESISQQPDYVKRVALTQITCTGYSAKELGLIEHAFEVGLDTDQEDVIFFSLMAVVNVLAEIHGIDLETTEKAKQLFVKSLKNLNPMTDGQEVIARQKQVIFHRGMV